jgi:metal-responsive CopG/Arc/MetJ family transcriptional regulator
MAELRSERFSVSLTPSALAKLDAYAAERRWTRSTAAAELIERGLDEEKNTDG